MCFTLFVPNVFSQIIFYQIVSNKIICQQGLKNQNISQILIFRPISKMVEIKSTNYDQVKNYHKISIKLINYS